MDHGIPKAESPEEREHVEKKAGCERTILLKFLYSLDLLS